MADVAAVKVPERSLFERVARVPSLLNQGVESMVAGTVSIPALVADGYLNIYRSARQAMGGEAFEASNLYERSKASLINAGRTIDGTKGKVIEAETDTEKNIVFGTELVTGLVGPGALKSVKTLSEGFNVAKGVKAGTTATKATAETGVKAAAKEGTVDWVAPTLSKEAAEFAAKKATERAAREAAEATAKTTAKEGVEAAAGATAGAAAKAATKEAAEATSKNLLGVAAKAGSYAWTGLKVTTFPFRHPVLSLGLVSGAHLMSGGKSSEMIWDGAIGSWTLAKDVAPAATSAVFEGTLKLGDGLMGFLATGGKKGADGLKNHLPPGTPLVLREALGSVSAPKPEGETAPTEQSRTGDVVAAARERAQDAVEDIDFMDSPEIGPFREMIAQQLNMDPAKVNGKAMTAKLGELAKDNPYFAAGMAFGSIYGMMGEGKSKKERALGAVMYGALFGVAFQFLGQMYPGLGPALMKMLGGVPDMAAKVPGAIGLNTSSLNGGFKAAAEGTAAAPTSSAPAQGPNTPVASKFEQAASGNKPALTPAPAPEDTDLRRNRPEAANNPAYRLTVGA